MTYLQTSEVMHVYFACGLVLAALRPDMQMTLVEADARKGAFLGEAARRMSLKLQPKVVVSRIESAPPTAADIVTARALAPLGQLLTWAAPHRADKAICLFHKGKGWQVELTGAMKDWDIVAQPFASVTDLDAVILRVGAYKRKGAARAQAAAAVRRSQSKGRRRQDDDGD